MENGLFEAHSGWRYIVIVVTILAVLKLLLGMISNSKWSKLDQGLGTALPIVLEIQLLLGLVLWLINPGRWFLNRGTVNVWEHLVTMLIAIAVARIAWARVKRADVDAAKYRIGTIGFIVSGLFMGLGVMRITGVM